MRLKTIPQTSRPDYPQMLGDLRQHGTLAYRADNETVHRFTQWARIHGATVTRRVIKVEDRAVGYTLSIRMEG